MVSEAAVGVALRSRAHTMRWVKIKVQNYREGERGWEPKGGS